MPIPSTPDAFLSAMHSLEGRVCWATSYGPSTGSTIQLLFEPKLLRAEPLRNPALTEDERRFDGECSIFVSCSWTLLRGGEIRFRSRDAISDPITLGGELACLVGQSLVGVEAREPRFDATLDFTGASRLRLIADRMDDHDNYDISTRDEVYTVWPRGRLTVEPRERS